MKLGLRKRRRFDLSKALFILPNLFTVSSIFCGFYGAVLAASASGPTMADQLYRACIAVLFAMVFDAVDGRVARLTRTQSDFGVQMDSLADVISFGVVPGLIAWHWGLNAMGTTGLFACFTYCACGAIRLARFNVMAAADDGPSTFFLGLPIPAAAGFLVAAIISTLGEGAPIQGAHWWAPALLYALGFLMVSNVRFRTFKATKLDKKAIFVLVSIVIVSLLIATQISASFAIVILMGAYLGLGVAEAVVGLLRRSDEAEVSTSPVHGPYDDDEEELID